MALTDQPYLPLYVDDWMNNSKLKLCSPGAHGLMVSIMCLMHKSESYGIILLKQKYKQSDKQISNFACQVAKQTSFDLLEVTPLLEELISEKVLVIDADQLICLRMVKDAKISLERSKSGKKGGDRSKEFAQAKGQANIQANTGIEYVNGIVNGNGFKYQYREGEFFETPEEAFTQIRDDEEMVNSLVRIARGSGYLTTTDLQVMTAVKRFFVQEGAKPDFDRRPRDEIKKHLINWISKNAKNLV